MVLSLVMTRREKIVQSWRTTRDNARVDEVIAVLEHYFGAHFYKAEGTSHQLRIKHPALIGHPNFVGGTLSIPIHGGQSIKPIYLRQIVVAIDIVDGSEQDETNE